jgi:hypothetical protein
VEQFETFETGLPAVFATRGTSFTVKVNPGQVAILVNKKTTQNLWGAIGSTPGRGSDLDILWHMLRPTVQEDPNGGPIRLEGKALLDARRKRREELRTQLIEEERILKAAGAIAADLKVTPPEASMPIPEARVIEIRLTNGAILFWEIGKMGTEAALEMLRRSATKSKVIRIGDIWVAGRSIVTYYPKEQKS